MQTIHGKEEIKKLFEKLRQQRITLKLSFNIHETEIFGERAFVRGQVINTKPLSSYLKYFCSFIFQKQLCYDLRP